MSLTINSTDEVGAMVNGVFIAWHTLRAASAQQDTELAERYKRVLQDAEQIERRRVVRENWKRFGYPLLTGFGRQYAGQHVMRAWEIRRKRYRDQDVRVVYIVAWDRSINQKGIEVTSPELPDMQVCYEWLREHYGAWHDEYPEKTADAFLY